MAKQEFENVLRKITMLGYGLICLAHSEEKPVSMGSEDTIIRPLLNKRAYEIVNGLVDVIGYIGVSFDEEGNSHRHLYTRSTPEIFAGSRFQYLPAKIPFGYEQLTQALAEAIEKAGGEAGGLIVDHEANENTVEKSFDDVMEEAKKTWLSLGKDKEIMDKAGKIIERNFGKPMKLSEATVKQKEIVEAVVQELKELL